MQREKKSLEAKIVVIGDTGVGKSSITVRYAFNKFDTNQESTLGASYMEKICRYDENKAIKLQIWDTAGQQKYLAIAKLYYRDCRIAILVYDVTRYESFENMKMWAGQLSKHAPKNIIITVVGNKIDLLPNGVEEEVPQEKARAFAAQIQADYTRVSAKQDYGIESLFEKVAKKIGSRMEQNLSDKKAEQLKSLVKGQKGRQKKCC